MKAKIYFIDNFDSFSYNLVDEFEQMGCDLIVYRNNVNAEQIYSQMKAESLPVMLVLSPGPGKPSDAGCLLELIGLAKGEFPILGICLGHQALVESYGGTIGQAGETVHGKASIIELDEHPVFAQFGHAMPVARYHSLMANQVPEEISVIARYKTIPMAVYQRTDRILGFQFHPESILTPKGTVLLKQSMEHLLGLSQVGKE